MKGTASLAVTINRLTLADGRTVTLAVDAVGQEAKSTKGKDAEEDRHRDGCRRRNRRDCRWWLRRRDRCGIGGGAGAAHTMATRGAPAVIPAETELTFVLSAPITVRERR